MFGFSLEHLTLGFIILLFFGPRHLPRLGALFGKTLRSYRETKNGIIEPSYKKLGEDDVRNS